MSLNKSGISLLWKELIRQWERTQSQLLSPPTPYQCLLHKNIKQNEWSFYSSQWPVVTWFELSGTGKLLLWESDDMTYYGMSGRMNAYNVVYSPHYLCWKIRVRLMGELRYVCYEYIGGNWSRYKGTACIIIIVKLETILCAIFCLQFTLVFWLQ